MKRFLSEQMDVKHWLIKSKLYLNTDNTKVVKCTRSRNTKNINVVKMNGEYIENISTFSYLKMSLDRKLNFEKHVEVLG